MASRNNTSLTHLFNNAGQDSVLVFDMDNTIVNIAALYPQMLDNLSNFLSAELRISKFAAEQEINDMLLKNYYIEDEIFDRHGIAKHQTLQATFGRGQLDFKALHVEPGLKQVLDNIQAKKYILTNGISEYAESLMTHLNLRDCFEGIAGTDTLGFNRKPQAQAFDKFEMMFGLQGKEIHFFEDTPENLQNAHDHKGWHGYIVEGYRMTAAYAKGKEPAHVKSRLHTLMDLK